MADLKTYTVAGAFPCYCYKHKSKSTNMKQCKTIPAETKALRQMTQNRVINSIVGLINKMKFP